MTPRDPPDDGDSPAHDEEGVVRPEELDYTASERVAELSEGRYVVATDNDGSPEPDDEDQGADSEEGELARQQMAQYVSERNADYGFVLTACFGGDVAHHERFSDDVATAFGDLISWYVGRIDTEASPTEALGILLLASDTPVSYPTKTLAPILRRHDLALDDSIADLVEAIADEGLQLPSEESSSEESSATESSSAGEESPSKK